MTTTTTMRVSDIQSQGGRVLVFAGEGAVRHTPRVITSLTPTWAVIDMSEVVGDYNGEAVRICRDGSRHIRCVVRGL